MPTLTIKGMPDDLYQALKERATRNRRSLNSEILMCIERSVAAHRVDPESFLARAADLRAELSGPPLTDELLKEAIDEARP